MSILRIKEVGFFVLFLAAALTQPASAQDFTLTIEPASLTLVPGQSASFVVSLAPFAGLSNQVTLSVSNLPSNVTATISPQSLTPPAASILTLSAAAEAQLGSFSLDIVAAGGGITNDTSSSVTVNFGLLPVCTGAIAGQVTDIQTGQAVAGAPFRLKTPGVGYMDLPRRTQMGSTCITALQLGSPDNEPVDYSIADHHRSGLLAIITECLDLRGLRRHECGQRAGASPTNRRCERAGVGGGRHTICRRGRPASDERILELVNYRLHQRRHKRRISLRRFGFKLEQLSRLLWPASQLPWLLGYSSNKCVCASQQQCGGHHDARPHLFQ